jgi:hypothetical protein
LGYGVARSLLMRGVMHRLSLIALVGAARVAGAQEQRGYAASSRRRITVVDRVLQDSRSRAISSISRSGSSSALQGR